MNSEKFQKILAVVLLGTAFLLFIMIIAGASGVKGGAGSFLVSSFHLASVYIPLYLVVCAYALYARDSQKLIAGLNFSLLPFLNLTLLLHILTGNRDIPVSKILIDNMGRTLSSLFLLVLFLVESALVYKLGELLFPGKPWLPRISAQIPRLNRSVKQLQKGFKRGAGKLSQKSREIPQVEKEDQETFKREVFPFPDLPSPLDPLPDTDDSEIQSLISSVLKPDSPGPSQTGDFNPEKTLSISDVVDSENEEDSDNGNSEILQEADLPVMHESDPGIEFLINPEENEPSPIQDLPPDTEESVFELEENLSSDGQDIPDEVLPSEKEDPQGCGIDSESGDDSPGAQEADDDYYEDEGYLADRMEGLDQWRYQDQPEEPDYEDDPEEPEELEELDGESHSVEDKLSPEGETEKLGTLSKGLPPRHKRKKHYQVPVAGLLKDYPDNGFDQIDEDTRRSARALEETLLEFKIDAKVTGISKGPVITMFEIQPAPGVKVSRIVNLQDNLALRLAASRIRIVAPIPGKQAIGIEVPNKKRAIVSFSELVSSDDFGEGEYEIPVILGKDISGGNQIIDLSRTPHLLIAGSTGSGKSVCVNSLICSILFKKSPQDVKLMMVDPKIVELKLYNDIPHLLTPVITEPKRAFQAVQWCLYEMERRYSLLDAMGVRDIKSYNKRIKDRDIATTKLPYIVLVIDEFADLMATSGKELEGIVARLAAMSRAVGIHLVLATQRPSIDVITGLIKANFPSRIAFMVASKTDSRIIIDMMGAEKLLGKGDMLFTSAWDPFPSRMQGAFLAEDEVERVVSYVKTLGEPEYIDDEIFLDDEDDYTSDGERGDSSFSDPLYNKSLEIVMQAGKASASYLQRRLKIGYNRAARLVEEMEIQGIVGPQNGSKPRDILHIPDNPGSRVLNED